MGTGRVLVIDDLSPVTDLAGVLRRLVRRQDPTARVVVVSHRRPRLTGATARSVQVVRVRTPAEGRRVVQDLVRDGALLVRTGPPRRGATTITACLIVKDEEAVLQSCLDAVTPFVDEVVVYDTGSTDSTVALARSSGATVVEGYWDDDFAAARNRALEHCTGSWVLHVDADEVVTGDPSMLRSRLSGEPADVIPVVLVLTSWSGATDGDEARIVRLHRRGRALWSGRLHEMLVPAAGATGAVAATRPAPVRLMHSGYHGVAVQEKGKGARNLSLARAAVAATSEGDPQLTKRLSDLGRSLILAGHGEEAADVLERVRTRDDDSSAIVVAGRPAVSLLIGSGHPDLAGAWLTVLEKHGESRGNVALTRARIALADHDLAGAEDALRVAERAAHELDPWGIAVDRGSLTSVAADLAIASGNPRRALSLLVERARTHPEHVRITQLVRAMEAADVPWAQVLADAPEPLLDRSLREVVALDATLVLRWCEAFATARPGDHRPVVAACIVAGRADLDTAILWSARAREVGIDGFSPLRDYVGRTDRSRVERALALVVLADAFAETAALADLVDLVPQLRPHERADLTARCERLGVTVPVPAASASTAAVAR